MNHILKKIALGFLIIIGLWVVKFAFNLPFGIGIKPSSFMGLLVLVGFIGAYKLGSK